MTQPFDFKAILRPKEFLSVFNPHEADVSKDFGGNTYIFPAKGTLDIYAATHTKHNREGELEPVEFSATKIVQHFLGEDGISGHLGPLGLRVLSGDPKVDEGIKAEAIKTCSERLYINDLATRNAHMASVRVAKEAGQPAESPNRKTIEAFERITRYEAANKLVTAFQCQECMMPFANAELLDGHSTSQHKTTSAPTGSSAEVAALQAQVKLLTDLVTAQLAPALRKPGRPRKPAEV